MRQALEQDGLRSLACLQVTMRQQARLQLVPADLRSGMRRATALAPAGALRAGSASLYAARACASTAPVHLTCSSVARQACELGPLRGGGRGCRARSVSSRTPPQPQACCSSSSRPPQRAGEPVVGSDAGQGGTPVSLSAGTSASEHRLPPGCAVLPGCLYSGTPVGLHLYPSC